MEMRYLKLVKAIVEEGSIAAASEILFLTPGALSQQLKEAESRLGTPIFFRVNKKMVLTPSGNLIYELANKILFELKNIDNQITELLNGEKGEIRLSTQCYTSYHWLPSLMKRFNTQYPNVQLRIVIEATHDPLSKLLSGDLDLAITSDPIDNPNIQYFEIFQDEMLAVVNSKHPWKEKSFVEPADFSSVNLIIHSLPLDSVTVHRYFLSPEGISPESLSILPLTEASIEMVKADMGVMVMANWALRPYLKDPSLISIPLGKKGLHRRHFIAILKQNSSLNYLNHFIDFIKKEIDLK